MHKAEQACANSFKPHLLKITPQIPPSSQSPEFAAFTTASTV